MRDFFKYVFASLVGFALFTTLSLGALVALLVSIAITAQEPEPRVKKDSMLVFDLSTEITDAQPGSTAGEVIGEALSGEPTTSTIALRTVLDAIEQAAADDRIVGIYLDGNIMSTGVGSGFATMHEVRKALLDFKESGKPIIAYATLWNERDYYLTSVADTLALNPNGLLELNGFKAETLFFGEALERIGIGISAIRAGQYKSAVEPFLRNERSPEEREQTAQLLNELWQDFLNTTAAERDVTAAELQQIANTQGLITPEDALAAKLIDQVAYSDDVINRIHELTKEDETNNTASNGEAFRQIDLEAYAHAVDAETTDEFGSQNQIAVVYAEGNIVNGEGGFGQIGGDRFARLIRSLRTDENVKAIVLRVNSPGGSSAASDIIAHEIKLAKEEKPVLVSMGSVAASGGYLISTYSDQIFASPSTITGSIGAFGLFPNFQELANENGVTWDVVKTGRYADIGTVSRPPTDAEVAIAQGFVDQIYGDFLDSVASSRPLSREKLEEVAQGRVWSGLRAKELGLVDELGGLEETIEAAANQANLDTWTLVEYPRTQSFEEQLLDTFLSSYQSRKEQSVDPMMSYLYRLKFEFETLRSLNDPRGVYNRLPFTYWIE